MNKSLILRATIAGMLALALDQGLKIFVRQNVAPYTSGPLSASPHIHLIGPLNLLRVENTGSAFGFYQGLWLWILLALIGVLLVPLYGKRLRRNPLMGAIGAGLQAGGAISNLLDRVMFGGVTDMIYVGGGVIFNLADVFVAVGMVLVMVTIWKSLTREGLNNSLVKN